MALPTPTPTTPGRVQPGSELDLHPGARTYEDEDESLATEAEPGSPLLKTWAPSQNYRYELRDITEQMTPAEAYRHKLITAGKEKRVLQRLEWKWKRHFELWSRSCTLIKAGYRGMLGRREFAKVKEKLALQLAQRRCKEQAVDAYMNGEPQLALDTIEGVPEMTRELFIIKFKILYTTGRHEDSIHSTQMYLQDTPDNQDANFILAASLTTQNEYQRAYDVLNRVLALGRGHILDEVYVLHAQLCIKLHSNTVSLWPQAVNDYDYLIAQHPEDMNFVLQRGMIYSMLQEFEKAIADFDYILYYQPALSTVLCLRARCHAARRMWAEARLDYDTLLYYEPESAEAQAGIADVEQEYIDLPMIDPEFVNGQIT